MNLMSVGTDIKITIMNDVASANTTSVTPSAPVDMTGFDAVAFIAITGDVAATSVITITSYEVASNTNTGGTAVTASAATFTAGATDADLKCLVSELVRPTTQYAYPVVTRTVANAVINGIIALQYNADKVPVTQVHAIATALAARN